MGGRIGVMVSVELYLSWLGPRRRSWRMRGSWRRRREGRQSFEVGIGRTFSS